MSLRDRIANSSLFGKAWNWHKREVISKPKPSAEITREMMWHLSDGTPSVPPSSQRKLWEGTKTRVIHDGTTTVEVISPVDEDITDITAIQTVFKWIGL